MNSDYAEKSPYHRMQEQQTSINHDNPNQQTAEYGQMYQQPPQYSNPDFPPQYNQPNEHHKDHDESRSLLHDNSFEDKFSNREFRMNFVRKVYGILSAQLLFTALFVMIPLFNTDIAIWMRQNWGLLVASLVGNMVTSIALICCRSLARSVPINYILLGIFTLCEAYLVGFIASSYQPEVVLAAAFSTAGVTAAISFYAYTTKSDFTICGPVFLIVMMTMCITTLMIFIFGLTTGQWHTANMIYCGIAVILFSFYLLFDTQLIMGGKRYEIELDDYILGAIILYTDIITIFLYLLRIFGGK